MPVKTTDCHNAALNAALITSQMDFVGYHPLNVVDAIADAATTLDEIESEFEGLNMWDHEGHCDWETVCARIAEYIRTNSKNSPDKQTIIEFIKDNA